jgi:hypothetical protein
MSPSIADPFRGHLAHGDPRGPLSAAGGCTWPTVPAYRYAIRSDDATGQLAFLNHNPIIIEYSPGESSHNLGVWNLIGDHYSVDTTVAIKHHVAGTEIYTWYFWIMTAATPQIFLNFSVPRDVETCNRDIPLPDVHGGDPQLGETGDTFRMDQVEWDKTSPPTA